MHSLNSRVLISSFAYVMTDKVKIKKNSEKPKKDKEAHIIYTTYQMT